MTTPSFAIDLPGEPAATERLGEWLGHHLLPGDTVALVGDLGAGKTTLVRGLGRGLQLDDPEAVSSPTYLLVVEHPGPKPLLHADAYLPQKLVGFLEDGGLDYLLDRRAIVVVEWAERIRDYLPADTLWLQLAMAPGGGRRVGFACQDPHRFPFLAKMPKIGTRD
ncbi:MAG: tRNA (adenosine(37)-N6)-threonylcarbamoyltransferase complex ATPase subunit type 1 TsaE [Planctomycetes bacterium]|jgi:tRNA threonylcarbamoyladenosine biosynthesis protein TsaE|nr:tRNA (adenosine(37)-N6)-threonylcarbamoyltransferase complex ATPase subunit type 1 TsaE [Planctomycetota bacterium]